jgi:hypothetical protein
MLMVMCCLLPCHNKQTKWLYLLCSDHGIKLLTFTLADMWDIIRDYVPCSLTLES